MKEEWNYLSVADGLEDSVGGTLCLWTKGRLLSVLKMKIRKNVLFPNKFYNLTYSFLWNIKLCKWLKYLVLGGFKVNVSSLSWSSSLSSNSSFFACFSNCFSLSSCRSKVVLNLSLIPDCGLNRFGRNVTGLSSSSSGLDTPGTSPMTSNFSFSTFLYLSWNAKKEIIRVWSLKKLDIYAFYTITCAPLIYSAYIWFNEILYWTDHQCLNGCSLFKHSCY